MVEVVVVAACVMAYLALQMGVPVAVEATVGETVE